MVLVPTKNATKNHLAIVEGVQPTNSKLGGLKLPNAIREPVKFYLADFSVKGGGGEGYPPNAAKLFFAE